MSSISIVSSFCFCSVLLHVAHKLFDGLAFTRDDQFLMIGSVDTMIKFWDVKTGKEARAITMPPNEKTK